MGAALAVEALAKRNIKARALVLWDPIVSGAEYLLTLEKLHAETVFDRKAPLRSSDELMGARFPQDLRNTIQDFDLARRLQKVDVQRTALVVSEDLPEFGALINSMRRQWPEAAFRAMGHPAGWDNLKAANEGRMTGPIMRAVADAVESLS